MCACDLCAHPSQSGWHILPQFLPSPRSTAFGYLKTSFTLQHALNHPRENLANNLSQTSVLQYNHSRVRWAAAG